MWLLNVKCGLIRTLPVAAGPVERPLVSQWTENVDQLWPQLQLTSLAAARLVLSSGVRLQPSVTGQLAERLLEIQQDGRRRCEMQPKPAGERNILLPASSSPSYSRTVTSACTHALFFFFWVQNCVI